MRRGSINFSQLKTLVVDEADQMFHIGFKREVDDILRQLPKNRQTLCFSATISHLVDTFSSKYLTDPKYLKAPKKQLTLENITQFVVETSNRRKYDDFVKVLKQNFPNKAIIFCRTRMGTHGLYEEMLASGFNVEELHGSLTQAKHEFVMTAFRDDKIKFLVATDVATRGLDVEGVTHVFNYNLPDDPESYVHRIGRTGRAGHSGVVYTILTDKDSKKLVAIEAFIHMKINRCSVSEKPVTTTQKSKRRNPSKKSRTMNSTENRKSSSKQNKSLR